MAQFLPIAYSVERPFIAYGDFVLVICAHRLCIMAARCAQNVQVPKQMWLYMSVKLKYQSHT